MISNLDQPLKYELTFKGLFNKKCKPIVVVTEKALEWNRVGTTEISNAKENIKIEFKKSIIIEYHKDKTQNLMIDVRNVEKGEFIYPIDHKCIVSCNVTLNEIIEKGIFKEVCGSLEIKAHPFQDSTNNIIIKIQADNLDKKDLLTSSSDPYLNILKEMEGHGFVRVYQSEIIKKCLNPSFNPINLNLCNFNSNDMSKRIKFEIYDYNKIQSHELIGEFITTTQDLLNGVKEFEIINSKKKSSKSNYKNSGTLKVCEVTILKTPTIFDYINGGFNINVMIGINCATSISSSTKENLHDINDIHSNQYIQAIQTVCNTLRPFNSSNTISIKGFGCNHERLNENGEACNCKPFKFEDHQVCSTQDAVNSYINSIGSFSFNSPSNFSELINHASKKAKKKLRFTNNSYSILVILTHGDIPEGIYRPNHTISAHSAATSPLSIIIVGMGSDEFKFTRHLDGDKYALKNYEGEEWKRDCVQFVQFNHHYVDPQAFSQELIAEIPTQFLSYVKMNHILPPR